MRAQWTCGCNCSLSLFIPIGLSTSYVLHCFSPEASISQSAILVTLQQITNYPSMCIEKCSGQKRKKNPSILLFLRCLVVPCQSREETPSMYSVQLHPDQCPQCSGLWWECTRTGRSGLSPCDCFYYHGMLAYYCMGFFNCKFCLHTHTVRNAIVYQCTQLLYMLVQGGDCVWTVHSLTIDTGMYTCEEEEYPN